MSNYAQRNDDTSQHYKGTIIVILGYQTQTDNIYMYNSVILAIGIMLLRGLHENASTQSHDIDFRQ